MNISHKIELKPNNKAITYFKKSFGCARFAYNWALGKHKEYYEKGEKKSCYDLNKEFNAIKREQYPFELDRDYNASLNLFNLISSVGRVPSEYTPADLAAMLSDLLVNRLVTSKVETGMQLRFIS